MPALSPVRFGQETAVEATTAPDFHPARPNRLVLKLAQWLNRFQLARQRLEVSLPPADFERLKSIPLGTGIVLAMNHPGPLDRKIALELSRRWKQPLRIMAAREVFEYGGPLQRRWLQALGAFSVSRGQKSDPGLTYAIEQVQNATAPVLICPEAEETFRTDRILPLKPGAAAIALKAASRGNRPTVIVPVSVRYGYAPELDAALNLHLSRLEEHLDIETDDRLTLPARFDRLLNHLLEAWQVKDVISLPPGSLLQAKALPDIMQATLTRLERRHGLQPQAGDDGLARTFRVIHQLDQLPPLPALSRDRQAADIVRGFSLFPMAALDEGLAESDRATYREQAANAVSRLELELLKQWPPAMQGWLRTAEIRIGEPMAVQPYLEGYRNDQRGTVGRLTQTLRTRLQSGLDRIP